jgi:hypothetical protein
VVRQTIFKSIHFQSAKTDQDRFGKRLGKTQKRTLFCAGWRGFAKQLGLPFMMHISEWCEKTLFWSYVYVETIDLPRQARDKHEKNAEKEDCFLRAGRSFSGKKKTPNPYGPPPYSVEDPASWIVEDGCSAPQVRNRLRLHHFQATNRSFCQDRLGTNIGKLKNKYRCRADI